MTLVYIANTIGLSQHVSFFTVTHCSKLFMRNRFVAVWPVGKAQAGGNGLGSTKNFSTLSVCKQRCVAAQIILPSIALGSV